MEPIVPNTHPSDEDVLVAAQRGDDRAFRQLYERFKRPLLALARKWAPRLDPLLSEDILQEALAKVAAVDQACSFDPTSQSAFTYVAGFIPNAAQSIVAQHRQPGERSREPRQRTESVTALVPQWRWSPTQPQAVGDYEHVAVADNLEAIDARIDLERVASRAEPEVARAIALVIERDITLMAAAKAVGMTPTTLSRRLSGFGKAA